MTTMNVFTSGEAEAMCRAQPPSISVTRATPDAAVTPLHASKLGAVIKASIATGPVLNCDDLPEAVLQGGSGIAARGRKFRVKSLGLPTLAEADDDSIGNEPWQEHVSDSDCVWTCRACMFTNHELMPRCEVCQADRGNGPNVASCLRVETAAPPLQGPGLDAHWPELQVNSQDDVGSWIDCEISSMASSWLDVGNAYDLAVDSDELDVTLFAESSVANQPVAASPLLWSARLQRGGLVQVTPMQRPGKAMTSVASQKQPRSSKVIPSLMPNDDCLELDNLEDQRLRPCVTRGATQRRSRNGR